MLQRRLCLGQAVGICMQTDPGGVQPVIVLKVLQMACASGGCFLDSAVAVPDPAGVWCS
jgi:hypothetical protein